MGKEWNQKRWYGHEGLGCHMPFWANGMLSYSVSIPWDLFLNGLCQLQEKLEESMEICAKSVKSMGLDYFICILYVKSIELYNWRSLWLWTSIRKGAFQQHGDRLKERLLEKIKKIEIGIQKKNVEMHGNVWKCMEMPHRSGCFRSPLSLAQRQVLQLFVPVEDSAPDFLESQAN